MNPENFSRIDDPSHPGRAWRRMDVFTEREVRVSFIKFDADASVEIGDEPATEIAFIRSRAIVHHGESHPAHTAFSTASGDGMETLVAAEPTELFYVKLPTF